MFGARRSRRCARRRRRRRAGPWSRPAPPAPRPSWAGEPYGPFGPGCLRGGERPSDIARTPTEAPRTPWDGMQPRRRRRRAGDNMQRSSSGRQHRSAASAAAAVAKAAMVPATQMHMHTHPSEWAAGLCWQAGRQGGTQDSPGKLGRVEASCGNIRTTQQSSRWAGRQAGRLADWQAGRLAGKQASERASERASQPASKQARTRAS